MYTGSYVDFNTFDWYKGEMLGNVMCTFENQRCYNAFFEKHLVDIFYMLPRSIVVAFYGSDFKVAFVEETTIGKSDFSGLFIAHEKIILIPLDEECNKNVITNSLLHEFGHFVDYMIVEEDGIRFSDTKEFKKIIRKEFSSWRKSEANVIKNILASFGKDIKTEEIVKGLKKEIMYYKECKEYFAESFSILLIMPQSLSKYAPRTYKYMSKLLEGEILNSEDFNAKEVLKIILKMKNERNC